MAQPFQHFGGLQLGNLGDTFSLAMTKLPLALAVGLPTFFAMYYGIPKFQASIGSGPAVKLNSDGIHMLPAKLNSDGVYMQSAHQGMGLHSLSTSVVQVPTITIASSVVSSVVSSVIASPVIVSSVIASSTERSATVTEVRTITKVVTVTPNPTLTPTIKSRRNPDPRDDNASNNSWDWSWRQLSWFLAAMYLFYSAGCFNGRTLQGSEYRALQAEKDRADNERRRCDNENHRLILEVQRLETELAKHLALVAIEEAQERELEILSGEKGRLENELQAAQKELARLGKKLASATKAARDFKDTHDNMVREFRRDQTRAASETVRYRSHRKHFEVEMAAREKRISNLTALHEKAVKEAKMLRECYDEQAATLQSLVEATTAKENATQQPKTDTTEADNTVKDFHVFVKAKMEETAALAEEIDLRDTLIDNKDATIRLLEDQVRRRDEQLQRSSSEIKVLTQDVTVAKAEVGFVKDAHFEHVKKTAALEAKRTATDEVNAKLMEEKDERIEWLDTVAKNASKTIVRLQAELNACRAQGDHTQGSSDVSPAQGNGSGSSDPPQALQASNEDQSSNPENHPADNSDLYSDDRAPANEQLSGSFPSAQDMSSLHDPDPLQMPTFAFDLDSAQFGDIAAFNARPSPPPDIPQVYTGVDRQIAPLKRRSRVKKPAVSSAGTVASPVADTITSTIAGPVAGPVADSVAGSSSGLVVGPSSGSSFYNPAFDPDLLDPALFDPALFGSPLVDPAFVNEDFSLFDDELASAIENALNQANNDVPPTETPSAAPPTAVSDAVATPFEPTSVPHVQASDTAITPRPSAAFTFGSNAPSAPAVPPITANQDTPEWIRASRKLETKFSASTEPGSYQAVAPTLSNTPLPVFNPNGPAFNPASFWNIGESMNFDPPKSEDEPE